MKVHAKLKFELLNKARVIVSKRSGDKQLIKTVSKSDFSATNPAYTLAYYASVRMCKRGSLYRTKLRHPNHTTIIEVDER